MQSVAADIHQPTGRTVATVVNLGGDSLIIASPTSIFLTQEGNPWGPQLSRDMLAFLKA